jgi:hypothetical protein
LRVDADPGKQFEHSARPCQPRRMRAPRAADRAACAIRCTHRLFDPSIVIGADKPNGSAQRARVRRAEGEEADDLDAAEAERLA